jgi:hypothetical protein
VKEQKENKILTRPESRHSSRPDVFYFLLTTHFLKTIIASRTNGTFDFAPAHEATNPSAKSKEPFLSQRSKKNLYFAF